MFYDGTRTAYALAVKVYLLIDERKLWYCIKIPERAQYIRIYFLKLQDIKPYLALTTHAMDVGH